MTAVGIDLGTTFSAIAHVNTEGVPTVFPDTHDADLFRTPSVIHIGPVGCLVGNPVENLLEDQPDLPVARHAKLALGKGKPVYQDHLFRQWSAEALNALILTKLRRDAESHSYDQVDDAIITVPAQFGDRQRRAVRRAAELANLPLSSLVEEPVAAAAYLGIEEQKEQTLLVYDLGGGTFDATILRCSPNEVTVLATDGDDRLGGKWIDELLMDLMREELQPLAGADAVESSSAQIQLRRLAEQTKLKLCQPGRTQVRTNTLIRNQPFEFVLTQNHFEHLIAPMLGESLAATDRCLQTAGCDWSGIDRILLVGGSTLIPAVRSQVMQHSGKVAEDVQIRQPHKAVAFGAALLATNTGDSQRVPTLRQAISTYDVGVRIRDPRTGKLAIYKLIKRNSPLPTSAARVFRTTRRDQTRMIFEFVQAKGDAASAVSLGYFAFGPLSAPEPGYPVELSMHYDKEGIVHAAAKDAQTGQQIDHMLSHDESLAEYEGHDEQQALVTSVQVNL